MTSTEFASDLDNATAALQPIAMQLTRNAEDTKDLLQNTFMKAWSNKHRFRPGTNFKAWLYTIMRNTFLSDYQRKRRQRTYLDFTDNQFFINTSQEAVNAERADSSVYIDEIHKCIEALPSSYRTPFKMFLEGYKYEEISDDLSIPLGTVKSRIYLARQELKNCLLSAN